MMPEATKMEVLLGYRITIRVNENVRKHSIQYLRMEPIKIYSDVSVYA